MEPVPSRHARGRPDALKFFSPLMESARPASKIPLILMFELCFLYTVCCICLDTVKKFIYNIYRINNGYREGGPRRAPIPIEKLVQLRTTQCYYWSLLVIIGYYQSLFVIIGYFTINIIMLYITLNHYQPLP